MADAAGQPVRRALWLDAMDHLLRPHLSPSLAAHARLANVDGQRLVYLVDSPVWHARLRLSGADLLAAARSLGLPVTDFVVRTSTPDAVVAPVSSSRKPVSRVARDALREAVALLRTPDEDT